MTFCAGGGNTYGQLGTKNTRNRFDEEDPSRRIVVNNYEDTVVNVGSGVTQIGTAVQLTCVLQNGQVKCWGRNSEFRFSDSIGGRDGYAFTPIGRSGRFPVDLQKDHIPSPIIENGGDTLLTGVEAISIGDTHSCALKEGDIYCWGKNDHQQITSSSLPNTPFSGAPIQSNNRGYARAFPYTAKAIKVSGIPDEIDIKEVAVAGGITCVIADDTANEITDGIWCWGLNSFRQTGGGDVWTERLEPQSILRPRTEILPAVTPENARLITLEDGTPIEGVLGLNPSNARLGGAPCAIRSDKTLICWGRIETIWRNAKSLGHTLPGVAGWLTTGIGINFGSFDYLKHPKVIPGVENVEKILYASTDFFDILGMCILNSNEEIKCFGGPSVQNGRRHPSPFIDREIQAALGNLD